MTYNFLRKYPEIQENTQNSFKSNLSLEDVESLNRTICNDSSSMFNCSKCFPQVIKIPSSGSLLEPYFVKNDDYMLIIQMRLIKNGSAYWQVNSIENSITNGMHFYVISDNYSPVTFDFSVITFYISVVYLIGRLIRIVVTGGAYNIHITEMPNPDPLINLCTGIYVSRMNGDLKGEEELYFELIDILRSPEIIKMVTGRSSLKHKSE